MRTSWPACRSSGSRGRWLRGPAAGGAAQGTSDPGREEGGDPSTNRSPDGTAPLRGRLQVADPARGDGVLGRHGHHERAVNAFDNLREFDLRVRRVFPRDEPDDLLRSHAEQRAGPLVEHLTGRDTEEA